MATITDAAVAALAPLTSLRQLDLAGCLDLTDTGLHTSAPAHLHAG